MPLSPHQTALRPLLLLLLTILIWGINWPIMKIGLDSITPLWFSFYRSLLATLTLFVALALTKGVTLPTKQDLPVIFSVGVLQVGLSLGLIYYALQYVESGRSAILTYTFPIMIAPLAFALLGERPPKQKLAGLVFGIAGIAVLFNPLSFPWNDRDYLYGNGILLIAALMWAIAIVHVRGHNWSSSTLQVLPWQLLVGTLSLLPFTLAIEGLQWFELSEKLAVILLYNGPIASAFGFYAFISATRSLPANTTGMTSLGVPVVGMVSSALIIGESMTIPTLVGIGLICSGILLAIWKGR